MPNSTQPNHARPRVVPSITTSSTSSSYHMVQKPEGSSCNTSDLSSAGVKILGGGSAAVSKRSDAPVGVQRTEIDLAGLGSWVDSSPGFKEYEMMLELNNKSG